MIGCVLRAAVSITNVCIGCYNDERPHQALNMKYPGELYWPSPQP